MCGRGRSTKSKLATVCGPEYPTFKSLTHLAEAMGGDVRLMKASSQVMVMVVKIVA